MNTLNIDTCSFNLIIAIITVSMYIYIIYFMHNITRYLFKKNEIEKYNIDINCPVKQIEVDDELDSFIKGRWEEYFICNLGWKSINNVSQKDQEQIMLDMASIISDTISPVLLSKLSRFYNTNKNHNGISGIDKVIADRIQIIVLNYSVENNRSK